jgi:hypothetical protein
MLPHFFASLILVFREDAWRLPSLLSEVERLAHRLIVRGDEASYAGLLLATPAYYWPREHVVLTVSAY